MSLEGIHVVVRVRPPIKGESSEYDEEMVRVDQAAGQINVADVQCKFDAAFGLEAGQEDVYEVLRPTIQACVTVRVLCLRMMCFCA